MQLNKEHLMAVKGGTKAIEAWREANLGMRMNLRDANLRDTYLRGANLRGANLRGADLRGADLRDAYLSGANLRRADLRDADLRDAYLSGANLRGANLNWQSHALLSEILWQAANTIEQEMWAAFAGRKTLFCWKDFASVVPDSLLQWGKDALRPFIKDDTVLPKEAEILIDSE